MQIKRHIGLYLLVILLSACGGGGGNGGSDTSAVSHHVPYLLASPSFSYTANQMDSTKYDVTVTLEADGPTGVAFVNLWIYDKNDDSNFANLDLVNTPNTNTWSATTNSFLPLASGEYYVDSITLDDSDPFTGVTRSGWYFTTPMGGSTYIVDERETDTNAMDFLFYNNGTSNIGIARVTLP